VVVVVIDGGMAEFRAAALLRRLEGLRLQPYLCPAGRLTVGYGHVILPTEWDLRAGVSEEQAEALLLCDLAWSMYAARRVGRVLREGQQVALCSLIFNIGRAAWDLSSIRRLVVAGDDEAAAKEFGRWVKVNGVVSPGQVKRREVEREIFEERGDGLD